MSRSPRPFVHSLLVLFALQLAACGSDPAPAGNRIARQELRDAAGNLTQSWTYEYDSAGQAINVRGYTGAGALATVSTSSWAGGQRTQTVVTAASGNVLYTTSYAYVGGVLDRATVTYPSGTGDNYTDYVFAAGKKQTSTRYLKDGTLQGWNGFSYDAVSGQRTGVTYHDAAGAVTGSGTRTYVNGRLESVQLVNGSVTSSRSFSYESGPLAFDYDVLFEF